MKRASDDFGGVKGSTVGDDLVKIDLGMDEGVTTCLGPPALGTSGQTALTNEDSDLLVTPLSNLNESLSSSKSGADSLRREASKENS